MRRAVAASASTSLATGAASTSSATGTGTATAIAECDYRDLPVELAFTAYNREQHADTAASTGELESPTTRSRTYLPQVANVITFAGKRVFGAMAHNIDVDLGQPYGWVSARVRSRDADVRLGSQVGQRSGLPRRVGGPGADDGVHGARQQKRAGNRLCGLVAQSRDSGLKAFYGPFWMLRLRAA